MYLVIGATGNVGAQLVAQLREMGKEVRAFVRNAAKANFPEGTQIVVGHLDDEASLAAAAQGAEGIFYMQLEPSVKQAEKFINAIRHSGAKKIALLSSVGTHLEPKPVIGAAIAARDEVFRKSGLNVIYLCPNALHSNAIWWKPGIVEAGHVVDATDPGKTVPVDPYDVARIAALVLTQDGHAGKNYILNGPEALSAREQVEILSEVLGRSIDFISVTPEKYTEEAIQKEIMSQPFALAIQNLNELFRAGRAGVVAHDIINLTGIAPRSFRQWCEEHRGEFK